MYHVVVHFDIPAERRAAFVAAALADGRSSAATEPGTRRFELIADETDANRFYLDEAYEDAAAFQAHVDGPHFARFFDLIKEYAVGPTWLVRGTTIEEEG